MQFSGYINQPLKFKVFLYLGGGGSISDIIILKVTVQTSNLVLKTLIPLFNRKRVHNGYRDYCLSSIRIDIL